jgi:hypothetical protein
MVVLTREKEDGRAWVRNRLGDGEIRCSGWPNRGGGFQGVSPECFGVGGELIDERGAKGKSVAATGGL